MAHITSLIVSSSNGNSFFISVKFDMPQEYAIIVLLSNH